ncbi:related to PET127 [Phialocephala subalpina]|uniref:Related to PET127 n=1 Tax=Phialocephala subalpina TaxID=576137 RepID=A0A1L7X285_9HELO|nr:related to PET127 [Phialocephala subalpina]
MFASLSRGSSKATRSYICSSCLCNILTTPTPPPFLHDRSYKHASFSTTTATAYPEDGDKTVEAATAPPADAKGTASAETAKAKKKKDPSQLRRRRRREGTLISKSNSTLHALRESLLAEGEGEGKEQELQAEAPATTKKKKKAPKASKEKTTVVTEEDQATSELPPETAPKNPKKVPSPKKKAKKKAQSTPAAEADAVETEGSPGLKIIRSPSTGKGGLTKDALLAYQKKIENALDRRRLVAAIQGGSLPDNERKVVLRSLRASLLTRSHIGARTPGGQKSGPRFVKVKSYSPPRQTLKDAILHPQARSPFPRPYTRYSENRVGIEVPYKVGAPRSGNSPPIERQPPGPVSKAIGPKFLRGSMTAQEIETVKADSLSLVPVDAGSLDVPKLAYGLERVLFNPGVYQLQDPRTRVFNFDPYLQTVMPVSDFDFNALKQYVTSSRDTTLLSKAAAQKKKYTGSTSSMTSALAHFHFLLSQWRLINVGNLSKMFPVSYHTFTGMQRAPVSIFLRWRDGTYAIDADKQFDSASVLSMLGKSMEKLLTLPTEHFEKYRKGRSDELSEEERNDPEEFHYTTLGDFLMRSQLDAYDPRLPGTGMFDLKTRAVVSIRMDPEAYEQSRGYQIRSRHGEWESFEREYYDMIRSAFLKYSLQVRMGRMDGIFVAFHNTERIFGFQYISLEEMDYALHGTDDKRLGDNEFKLSLDLLNRVLDRATTKYPEKSLRIHFETRDAVTPFMYIFAEPVDEKIIEKIQATNRDKVEEFERQVLGLETGELTEDQRKAEWDALRAHVEETMEQDEHDVAQVTDDADDVDAMSEEERHEISAIVSSNAVPEENDGEENDEEVEEFEEETEAGDEDVETSASIESEEANVDSETSTSIQSEDANEDVDTEQASGSENELVEERESEQTDATTEENTSVNEVEESEEHQDSSEQLSTTNVEEVEAEEPNDQPSDEEIIDEDAAIDGTSSGPWKVYNDQKRPGENELMAMTLTIRNLIDGKYVAQPDEENYPPGAKWSVEYALAEVEDKDRARGLYQACKLRRQRIHEKSPDLVSDVFQSDFLEHIKELSKKGREWRDQQKKIEERLPVKALDPNHQKSSKAEEGKE